jgi:hypothetical protein
VVRKETAKPRKPISRRCTCCGSRFEPARSAVNTQKTCSAECRRRRRRKQAKRRRDREIQDHRVDERERQARCRLLRREQGGTTVKSTWMSRAGLPLQVAELEGLILRKWDKVLRVSRAGLARNLRSLLGSIGEKVARSGPKEGGCHEPA